MLDMKAILYTILARYAARSFTPMFRTTRLADIGIDDLDVPMILLDIEDALGIAMEMPSTTCDVTTIGDLYAILRAAISRRKQPPRRVTGRKKSNWMSTTTRH